MKNVKGIMMENTHEVLDGDIRKLKRYQSELNRSEIARCDESRDIRDKVVGGEPFTSSAGKRRMSELKGSEHGKAQSDENLHSDTTQPSESGRIGKSPQAKDTFTDSARDRKDAEHKSVPKYVKEIGRSKQLHS